MDTYNAFFTESRACDIARFFMFLIDALKVQQSRKGIRNRSAVQNDVEILEIECALLKLGVMISMPGLGADGKPTSLQIALASLLWPYRESFGEMAAVIYALKHGTVAIPTEHSKGFE